MLQRDDMTADEALEYAARLIEDMSLVDFGGVWAKKKREREDAELRAATTKKVRADCAAHIRAMINRPDLSPRAVLQRIAESQRGEFLLRDAWPLAWKGLCRIEARVVCNSNSIPPETSYVITLTEKGRAILDGKPETFPDRLTLR
jgi:hypothetical protein